MQEAVRRFDEDLDAPFDGEAGAEERERIRRAKHNAVALEALMGDFAMAND